MVEKFDLVINLDNENLYKVCEELVGIEKSNFKDANQLISNHYRYFRNRDLNGHLNTAVANLVPYSRVNLLMPSIANKMNPF
jgi:hypothetical protein